MEIGKFSPVRRAIIPIAGLGTRLLPFSKVIPKAMLPVHNKPSVQWIVEELNEAGIDEIIFVYSKGQEMIKEYFNEHTWYDQELRDREKHEHADQLENIRKLARFHFVEQQEQLGDGHAILQVEELINNEPVMVIFGDCLYHGDQVIKKIIQRYQEHGRSIIAVQQIPKEEAHHYGIIHADKENHRVEMMAEKPTSEHQILASQQPPMAIIGRYLLSPSIWPHLKKMHSDSGEARLIDALEALRQQEDLHALPLNGTWLDTGTLEGLQQANAFFRNQ